jgi:hypothetical protein
MWALSTRGPERADDGNDGHSPQPADRVTRGTPRARQGLVDGGTTQRLCVAACAVDDVREGDAPLAAVDGADDGALAVGATLDAKRLVMRLGALVVLGGVHHGSSGSVGRM